MPDWASNEPNLNSLLAFNDLARNTAPTLVIAGKFDSAPTPAAAREWASMIPNARSLELPTAHLSNIGAAGEFNQQVLTFLLGE